MNSQNTTIDRDALTMARSIALQESSKDGKTPNYNATGKSGEHGAYQWMPGNFENGAKQYGLDPNDFSPENQDKVAYYQIKAYKDKGYQPAEIASLWNSGSPDNWQNHQGVNAQGVSYDTGKYTQNVKKYYNQLSSLQSKAPTNQPKNSQQLGTGENVDTYHATFPASATDNSGSILGAGATAGLKSLGNVPSSLYNMGEGLVSAFAHPVRTSQGLLHAGAGAVEAGLNKLTGKNVQDENTATFDALTNSLKNRFGSLENLQRTATNDPLGFGRDVLTVIQGGAALGDATGITTGAGQAVNQAVSNVGQAVINPIKKAGNALMNVASEATAKPLGVGGGVPKESVEAIVGDEAKYRAYLKGLNGKASPEQLVDQTRDALGTVMQKRSQAYQDAMGKLSDANKTYDISPVYRKVDELLDQYKIKQIKDGLDFSRSKFALDKVSQNDIKSLVDYVKSYGTKVGDRTALGLDNLKQVVGGYWSPNSDYRSFVQGIKSSIWNPSTNSGVLSQVPGYKGAMADYGEISDQITDLQRGLSLGDKVAVETSWKKITSAFKQNNEFRIELIKGLDEATGGKLVPMIAGQQMSSLLPRGLASFEPYAVGVAASGAGIIPVLSTLLLTSPKLVGNFLRALRLPAQAIDLVNNTLTGNILGPLSQVSNVPRDISAPLSTPNPSQGLIPLPSQVEETPKSPAKFSDIGLPEYEGQNQLPSIFTPSEPTQSQSLNQGANVLSSGASVPNFFKDYANNLLNAWQTNTQNIGKDFKEAGEGLMKGDLGAGAKGLFRSVGDMAGQVYAPISAGVNTVLQDTGAQKFLDKNVINPIADKISNNPEFQQFAQKYPNSGEDFGRLLNIITASLEKGDIRNPLKKVKDIPNKEGGFIKNPLDNEVFDVDSTIAKPKPSNFLEVRKSLQSSGGDWDKAIGAGDIQKAQIYKPDGSFTTAAADHVVSDLAGKLDRLEFGLGKDFVKNVVSSNPTRVNLIQQAVDLLSRRFK